IGWRSITSDAREAGFIKRDWGSRLKSLANGRHSGWVEQEISVTETDIVFDDLRSLLRKRAPNTVEELISGTGNRALTKYTMKIPFSFELQPEHVAPPWILTEAEKTR